MAKTRGKKTPASKCPRMSAPSLPRRIAPSSRSARSPFSLRELLSQSESASSRKRARTSSSTQASDAQAVAPPACKRIKSSYADTFEVLVGSEEIVYTLHKNVAKRIPFFEAACSERWVEGQEKLVRLPDHLPIYFDVFVPYLYSGKLDLRPLQNDTRYNPHYCELVLLWVLGDYLGVPAFGNLVIDALLDRIRQWPKRQPTNDIWEDVRVDSNMWRLMVDHVTYSTVEKNLEKNIENWPIEVVRAIAKKHVGDENKAWSDPLSMEPCYYHEHKEGESCE